MLCFGGRRKRRLSINNTLDSLSNRSPHSALHAIPSNELPTSSLFYKASRAPRISPKLPWLPQTQYWAVVTLEGESTGHCGIVRRSNACADNTVSYSKWQRRPRLSRMGKFLSTLSNSQLVTGISILSSALLLMECGFMVFYHDTVPSMVRN